MARAAALPPLLLAVAVCRVGRGLAAGRPGGTPLLQLALGQDSECSDGPEVSMEACLAKGRHLPSAPGRCMWLETDRRNLCLPCEWDGIDMPCIPGGAVTPSGNVKTCQMACAHQKVLTKVSPCVDVGGEVSEDDCYAKGTSAGTKCMWTAYATADGGRRTMCGPCEVMGVGRVPMYAEGNTGPEPGSKVEACRSQCEAAQTEHGLPCDNGVPAVTPCMPLSTAEAEAQQRAKALEPVPLWKLGLDAVEGAPQYVAVRVPKPYGLKEYLEASEVAARAAGWPEGSRLPPDAAVSIYGPPPKEGPTLPPSMRIRYALPPPGIRGMPPAVNLGPATVPPPEALASASALAAAGAAPAAALEAPAALALTASAAGGWRRPQPLRQRRLRLRGPTPPAQS